MADQRESGSSPELRLDVVGKLLVATGEGRGGEGWLDVFPGSVLLEVRENMLLNLSSINRVTPTPP